MSYLVASTGFGRVVFTLLVVALVVTVALGISVLIGPEPEADPAELNDPFHRDRD